MIEKMDQIFVLLLHWLTGFLPAFLQPFAGVVHLRRRHRLPVSGAVCA